jgi:hypothetical protein
MRFFHTPQTFSVIAALKPDSLWLNSSLLSSPVLPGGRGHRQITQIRPYKKIICGEKLVAVKVAVSSNKVL